MRRCTTITNTLALIVLLWCWIACHAVVATNVYPLAGCWELLPSSGECIQYWGYDNTLHDELEVPAGHANYISRDSVSTVHVSLEHFAANTLAYDAFATRAACTDKLVWHLNGNTAASRFTHVSHHCSSGNHRNAAAAEVSRAAARWATTATVAAAAPPKQCVQYALGNGNEHDAIQLPLHMINGHVQLLEMSLEIEPHTCNGEHALQLPLTFQWHDVSNHSSRSVYQYASVTVACAHEHMFFGLDSAASYSWPMVNAIDSKPTNGRVYRPRHTSVPELPTSWLRDAAQRAAPLRVVLRAHVDGAEALIHGALLRVCSNNIASPHDDVNKRVMVVGEPITPIHECTSYDSATATCTTWWGYSNANSVTSVASGTTEFNSFSPAPVQRDQPRHFLPGTHHYVFATEWHCASPAATLIWTLDSSAQASRHSGAQRCRVGCDGVMGSAARYDTCGVCNGDNACAHLHFRSDGTHTWCDGDNEAHHTIDFDSVHCVGEQSATPLQEGTVLEDEPATLACVNLTVQTSGSAMHTTLLQSDTSVSGFGTPNSAFDGPGVGAGGGVGQGGQNDVAQHLVLASSGAATVDGCINLHFDRAVTLLSLSLLNIDTDCSGAPSSSVSTSRSVTRSGTPTRTASATASASAPLTATPTPTATPSNTPSSSAVPTVSISFSGTVSHTSGVSSTASASLSLSGTSPASLTGTASRTASTTSSGSLTASQSPTASITLSSSQTSSSSLTPSASGSVSTTRSNTPSSSGSASLTLSATPSETPTTTGSGTVTSSVSVSYSATTTASGSPSVTNSLSAGASSSETPSSSVSSSLSSTTTVTSSSSATTSVSISFTRTATATRTPSVTPTSSVSNSLSNTISGTGTASVSSSLSPTATNTPSSSLSNTASSTASNTATPSYTASATNTATPAPSTGYQCNETLCQQDIPTRCLIGQCSLQIADTHYPGDYDDDEAAAIEEAWIAYNASLEGQNTGNMDNRRRYRDSAPLRRNNNAMRGFGDTQTCQYFPQPGIADHRAYMDWCCVNDTDCEDDDPCTLNRCPGTSNHCIYPPISGCVSMNKRQTADEQTPSVASPQRSNGRRLLSLDEDAVHDVYVKQRTVQNAPTLRFYDAEDELLHEVSPLPTSLDNNGAVTLTFGPDGLSNVARIELCLCGSGGAITALEYNYPGSGAVLDGCGVCGGNGSTCTSCPTNSIEVDVSGGDNPITIEEIDDYADHYRVCYYHTRTDTDASDYAGGATLVSFEPYEQCSLRDTGSCDSRNSAANSDYCDLFEGPESQLNTPEWTLELLGSEQEPCEDTPLTECAEGTGTAGYRLCGEFSLSDLIRCKLADDESAALEHTNGANHRVDYTGTVYASELSPHDCDDEDACEEVISTTQRGFTLHVSLGGATSVDYSTSALHFDAAVHGITCVSDYDDSTAGRDLRVLFFTEVDHVDASEAGDLTTLLTTPIVLTSSIDTLDTSQFSIVPLGQSHTETPANTEATPYTECLLDSEADTRCRQAWVLNTHSAELMEFVGTLEIGFSVDVNDDHRSFVRVVLSFNVNCINDYNGNDYDDGSVSEQPPSALTLYHDEALSEPYAGVNAPQSFLDCATVYAQLDVQSPDNDTFSVLVVDSVQVCYSRTDTPLLPLDEHYTNVTGCNTQNADVEQVLLYADGTVSVVGEHANFTWLQPFSVFSFVAHSVSYHPVMLQVEWHLTSEELAASSLELKSDARTHAAHIAPAQLEAHLRNGPLREPLSGYHYILSPQQMAVTAAIRSHSRRNRVRYALAIETAQHMNLAAGEFARLLRGDFDTSNTMAHRGVTALQQRSLVSGASVSASEDESTAPFLCDCPSGTTLLNITSPPVPYWVSRCTNTTAQSPLTNVVLTPIVRQLRQLNSSMHVLFWLLGALALLVVCSLCITQAMCCYGWLFAGVAVAAGTTTKRHHHHHHHHSVSTTTTTTALLVDDTNNNNTQSSSSRTLEAQLHGDVFTFGNLTFSSKNE